MDYGQKDLYLYINNREKQEFWERWYKKDVKEH